MNGTAHNGRVRDSRSRKRLIAGLDRSRGWATRGGAPIGR